MASQTEPELSQDGPEPNEIVLYVKKATPTSGPNVVKILVLLELLNVPHRIVVLDSPAQDSEFKQINPYAMIPALKGIGNFSLPEGQTTRMCAFESSACLTYLVEQFDPVGRYGGRTIQERAQRSHRAQRVLSSIIRATGKWWLTFKTTHADTVGNALDVLREAIVKEYAILDQRLRSPGQRFIALYDRLTIADLAILPFANRSIAASAEIAFDEFPSLSSWSERLLAMDEVKRSFQRASAFGH